MTQMARYTPEKKRPLSYTIGQIFRRWFMKENKAIKQGKYAGKLVTLAEAAEYLRMGASTLYGKSSKGIIPYCPQSQTKRLFHIDCLDAFIEGKDVRGWWSMS
jgi:hypothetical protein